MLENQVGARASSRPCMKSPTKDIEPSSCEAPYSIKPKIYPNSFHSIEKEFVLVIMLSLSYYLPCSFSYIVFKLA